MFTSINIGAILVDSPSFQLIISHWKRRRNVETRNRPFWI